MTKSDRDSCTRLTILPRDIRGTELRIPNRSTGSDSPEENCTPMATPAQIEANRRNAEKSTGPRTEAGKARSCTNRLSHGFTSSVLFIAGEEREEFNLLLADLHNEFQPATASEQILLEKMVQNQWLSLRAYRLQSVALNVPAAPGYMPPDLGLLIRYHQSSDRGFYKARTELLTARKERQKSQIGFESQDAPQPAAQPREAPVPPPNPPDPPQETTPEPGLAIPALPNPFACDSLEDALEAMMQGPDGEIAKRQIAEWRARRKVA